MIVDPDVERYAELQTSPPQPLVAVLRAETQATMPSPAMAGGLVETSLLEALTVATRARRVLEIGTFTGVTALSIASRLPNGASVVTLEADERHAEIARRHIDASPWGDRVELVVGDALTSLRRIPGPFDLVFVDAWKRDYVDYYEAVLPKLADHGLIVADNVLWGGAAADDSSTEQEAVAVRAFVTHVRADDRVDQALLTVGDGLLLAWKRGADTG